MKKLTADIVPDIQSLLYLRVKEEQTVKVFQNRVLRIIFEPKREEVAAGWRILDNEELHNLYTSPSMIRVIK
jgi:hypothetical protein